jgi:hypothetical protein
MQSIEITIEPNGDVKVEGKGFAGGDEPTIWRAVIAGVGRIKLRVGLFCVKSYEVNGAKAIIGVNFTYGPSNTRAVVGSGRFTVKS